MFKVNNVGIYCPTVARWGLFLTAAWLSWEYVPRANVLRVYGLDAGPFELCFAKGPLSAGKDGVTQGVQLSASPESQNSMVYSISKSGKGNWDPLSRTVLGEHLLKQEKIKPGHFTECLQTAKDADLYARFYRD